MITGIFKLRFIVFVLCGLMLACVTAGAQAQGSSPLTRDELVRLVRQLPAQPSLRDEIIEAIRRRGIGFPLTSGVLSVVATKSGNDALLRRTLEEAERRRVNPAVAALPSEDEGREVLSRARAATLAAAEVMPDFVVREQIIRSIAQGMTKKWNVSDRLTLAVSYRAGEGEQYRLLAVNGLPLTDGSDGSGGLEKVGGATSTGEYVSRLTTVFLEESKAKFKMVDTDTLRGRRTIVYEYEIERPNSRALLTFGKGQLDEQQTTVGDRGRVWIDRETNRVLRLESISTEIPLNFPIREASRTIDYDWVTIAERPYLLPSRAVVEMTAVVGERMQQSRNDVRFRNYQKYGTEIKIIEEDIIEDEEPKTSQPAKP